VVAEAMAGQRAGFKQALKIGEGVTTARTLSATPPNIANPLYIARYCKALVRVGASSAGYDRKIGLPMEFILRSDPHALAGGDSLSAVLEFQGEPLAHVMVDLISLDDRNDVRTTLSDRRGRVTIRLPRAGRWMLAATHMRRVTAAAGSDVKGDWQSFWATLTFAVPGA
ncbi:MAG: DUF4198 domain-containing protein, partial [Myxococcota bacterium]